MQLDEPRFCSNMLWIQILTQPSYLLEAVSFYGRKKKKQRYLKGWKKLYRKCLIGNQLMLAITVLESDFRLLNPSYSDIILQLCLYLYTKLDLRKAVDTSWFPIKRNVACLCGYRGSNIPRRQEWLGCICVAVSHMIREPQMPELC